MLTLLEPLLWFLGGTFAVCVLIILWAVFWPIKPYEDKERD